jgi:ParB family transcriptional regulator, chromosome partitioning protein
MATQLEDLRPEDIKPNPENPRAHFRDPDLDRLAESVEEAGGVLVPVYVYRADDKYILIDGERRWQIAMRLGLERIPALVRDGEPEPAANIVEMFNIHMVREGWEEMPTARALAIVMERTGKAETADLSALTGISREQIARYKLLLELPDRYQRLVEDRKVPMNFFVELDRNVSQPLKAKRTGLSNDFDDERLRALFVEKYEDDLLDSIIDLRKVRKIITRAEERAGSADAPSDLDKYLKRLFEDKEVTIDEVYDESVAYSFEANKLTDQVRGVVARFSELMEHAGSDERAELVLSLVELRDDLTALIDEHA